MRALCCAVTILCGSVSLAEANSLRVAPILLDVRAPGATTTLNLRNDGDQKLHVQIRVLRWTGTAAEPTLEPTSDVVVSPPATTLLPGAEYVVRVVRTAKQPPAEEESYRVLVDEVPDSVGAQANTVRFAMRYSIPVFFAGTGVSGPDLSWSLVPKGKGAVLTASNSGGRHVRIANLKLVGAGGATILQRNGLVGYSLGKSTTSWVLPIAEKLPRSGPVRVVAESETGAINAMVAMQDAR